MPQIMGARQFVKRLAPPLLLDLMRGRPRIPPPAFTWQGIYAHLRDVPAEQCNYDSHPQVEKHLAWTHSALALVHGGHKPYLWHEALGLVAAMASTNSNVLRVLDFGGGAGSGYVQLLGTLPTSVVVDYHVVDLSGMCAAGRQLFADDSHISFHTELPALSGAVDIVYVNSVLQYIDDWAGLLQRLACLNARFILLARLAAGAIPTYATRQMNLDGHVLPYWFLCLDEVVALLALANYKLAYDGLDSQEYDQSNFPGTHRIGRMRNMLFVRSTETGTAK
jgi:putative methyltransferase (TIGR04325 family)